MGLGLSVGVGAVLVAKFGPVPVSSTARLWEQLAARAYAVDPQRLLPHHNPPGQAAAVYRSSTVWCRNRVRRVEAVAGRARQALRGQGPSGHHGAVRDPAA
ncbi:hypothetical protein GCM10010251_62340 [Streptomyces aurantiogriseus]|uniref:Uncharacterized protein n=1 Tax=Streptomyces aurantiogriseus TaxID=66870 RepID=A0A918FH37_9ACTN|nr:hypothetical protein GCM10010251_62340 [Streptomyces aurantiogriseus]